MALSVVFINVETPRSATPVDPFLVLLAACALAAVAQRAGGLVTRRRSGGVARGPRCG